MHLFSGVWGMPQSYSLGHWRTLCVKPEAREMQDADFTGRDTGAGQASDSAVQRRVEDSCGVSERASEP